MQISSDLKSDVVNNVDYRYRLLVSVALSELNSQMEDRPEHIQAKYGTYF